MLLRMSCLEHDLVVRANRTAHPNAAGASGGGGGGCQQQQSAWDFGDQVNTPDASLYSLIVWLITFFCAMAVGCSQNQYVEENDPDGNGMDDL